MSPGMLSKNKRPYDAASLAPRQRLRANLGELLARNELSGNRIGSLANDINAAAPLVCNDLASKGARPDHHTRKLKKKFLKQSQWMPDYIFDCRVWDPKKQKVEKDKVHMQLLHEIVCVLKRYGCLEKLLETGSMDSLTLEHLQSCEAEAGCKLLGFGIWGDGAPTQYDRSESIDVISMSLPGVPGWENLRIPLVVLPHSRTCAETWEDVFEVIKWCLIILATGVWPTARHNGDAWDEQTDKARKTARPLQRSCLCEVRQDWKFAAEVFGFPAQNRADGCCWACKCTPEQVIKGLVNRFQQGKMGGVKTPQGLGTCLTLQGGPARDPSVHACMCNSSK